MGVPRDKSPGSPRSTTTSAPSAWSATRSARIASLSDARTVTRLVVANADIAQSMAREFGWKYEELHGTGELLTKLLLARQSTDEVLVVPPHHVTAFDALNKTLTAVPIWESENAGRSGVQHLVFDDPGTGDQADRSGCLGRSSRSGD